MNQYFQYLVKLLPGTKARAEEVNARFESVAAGFDKLPAPHSTTTGFTDPVAVGDPTLPEHAVSVRHAMSGELGYAEDTGTLNAYIVNLPIPPVSLQDGLTISFKATHTNTGATTIDINGLGAKQLVRSTGANMVSGDIQVGQIVTAVYTGGKFVSTTAMPGQFTELAAQVQVIANGATASATAAGDSATAAANSAATATTQAGIATTKASEAAISASNAATSKTGADSARTGAETARTGAETARTGAETAKAGADTAKAGADLAKAGADTAYANTLAIFGDAQDVADAVSTATTKASEASTHATNAAGSAATSSTKAVEAATSATNAAGSATTATTKAGEAATSATSANNSKNAAATYEQNALSHSDQALSSATAASTSATIASSGATTATTQAGIATSKASEAATSATNAATSVSTATTKASEASASASTATTQAGIATTKATEAAASAASAVAAPGTNATSTTSLAVGTGSKSLTVQTGKSFVVGMPVTIARTSDAANTWMHAMITSYNSGTGALVVTADLANGTGTFTDWTVSVSAPLAIYSPNFVGTPTAPTATAGTNTTQIATTEFVQTAVTPKAPIASPTFTGVPAAPTASPGTNTTQLATTAFVAALGAIKANLSGKLNQFAATTSAELAGVISDETGSGALVFADSPTLVTPSLGVATGTSFNSITGLSTVNPAMNGTVAVGTATTVARADHVHASDTSLQATSGKDASGGYAGLTLLKINFKNAANTFTSFLTNSSTAARTYTFQDKDGTIADLADVALKAPLASPALTGTPTAPTASAATNTTQIATTAFVQGLVALKANLASPALTGTPTAPTATAGTNTTQIATTAFVAALGVLKADIASPTFTGTPVAPTAAVGTNTTQLATTAFVKAEVSSMVKLDKLQEVGNAGTAKTLDTASYDTFTLTCDQATLDLSATTIALGRTVTLVLTGADNCTITWPTGVQWPGGSPPTFSAGTDRVVMQRVSATAIHASLAGAAYA
jgi:hypothetical protein